MSYPSQEIYFIWHQLSKKLVGNLYCLATNQRQGRRHSVLVALSEASSWLPPGGKLFKRRCLLRSCKLESSVGSLETFIWYTLHILKGEVPTIPSVVRDLNPHAA